MGRKRTVLAALLLLATFQPATGAPFPTSSTQRAEIFATCAGRYHAMAEHLSLFGGAGVDAAARRRDTFVLLLEAVSDDAVARGASPVHLMALRVQERATLRALLSRVSFAEPGSLAAPSAQASITQRMETCDALLLGV